MQLLIAAVALVNSGAMHSFISVQLVSKHSLTVSPDKSTLVTLADGSSVEASEMCVVPLAFCYDTGHAVLCTVEL